MFYSRGWPLDRTALGKLAHQSAPLITGKMLGRYCENGSRKPGCGSGLLANRMPAEAVKSIPARRWLVAGSSLARRDHSAAVLVRDYQLVHCTRRTQCITLRSPQTPFQRGIQKAFRGIQSRSEAFRCIQKHSKEFKRIQRRSERHI